MFGLYFLRIKVQASLFYAGYFPFLSSYPEEKKIRSFGSPLVVMECYYGIYIWCFF